jgi:signal peptidase I
MTIDPTRPILSYADSVPNPVGRRGRGFLAVCVGFSVTGLGHVIIGRFGRGLAWFLGWAVITCTMFAALCVPRLAPALIILFPLSGIWSIGSLVDAYLCGRRSTLGLLHSPVVRYVTGIAIIIVSLVAGRFANPSVAIARYVKQHVTEGFVITTRSMAPALVVHDRVLCSKKMAVSRWNVAVVDSPMVAGERLVKRIVGLPGERLQIINGHVSINGIALASPPGIPLYVTSRMDGIPIHGPGCDGPIVLGPDEYYVLGDNTTISADSRYWPSVGHHQPQGRIIWPIPAIIEPPSGIFGFYRL